MATTAPSPAVGSAVNGDTAPSSSPTLSYAAKVQSPASPKVSTPFSLIKPLFTLVPVTPKPIFSHEGEPAVFVNPVEVSQAETQLQFTLVAKFSSGRTLLTPSVRTLIPHGLYLTQPPLVFSILAIL